MVLSSADARYAPLRNADDSKAVLKVDFIIKYFEISGSILIIKSNFEKGLEASI